MRSFKTILFVVLCSATFVGCSKKQDSSYDTATTDAAPANPYAVFSGDWLTEVYTVDSEEPVMVVLTKVNESPESWTTKFTYLDEPVVANNVFMKDDSVVVSWGPYPSGLREGVTVQTVTSYLHRNGDTLSGRFHAVYEGGDELRGRMEAERVE